MVDDKKLELIAASLPNAYKPMLWLYVMMVKMERDFNSKRTKEASAKARDVKLRGLELIKKLGMMQ